MAHSLLCGISARVIFIAYNGLRLGAVPHITNLIINHCTFSGIALNRCWAQYFIQNYGIK
jgi:hypothetical protein